MVWSLSDSFVSLCFINNKVLLLFTFIFRSQIWDCEILNLNKRIIMVDYVERVVGKSFGYSTTFYHLNCFSIQVVKCINLYRNKINERNFDSVYFENNDLSFLLRWISFMLDIIWGWIIFFGSHKIVFVTIINLEEEKKQFSIPQNIKCLWFNHKSIGSH